MANKIDALTYSPKQYGVPLGKGQQPSKPRPFNITEEILLPLADAYEEFIADAYPARPLIFAIARLDEALRRCHFKMAKRFFEYHKSPAFAHAFAKAVEGPVIALNRFHYSLRTHCPDGRTAIGLDPEKWSEDQRQEYGEIVDGIEGAADYLRQLAWMIGGKAKPAYSPEPARKVFPKGFDKLGPKKFDCCQILNNHAYGLTAKQRDVFSLRCEWKLSFTEIGARLGIKHQTAREHYDDAQTKLRKKGRNLR